MTGNRGFSLIEVLVALALVGCLAAITTYQAMKSDGTMEYDRTIAVMDDIRMAVMGRQDLYCNGQRQFSGYVADMGSLPALVDTEGDIVGDLVAEKEEEQVLLFPQPRALWTRDINGDGDTVYDPGDIPEIYCWKYYENERIWAGWRGPYITPPEDGVLKDGWGNPLLFSDGEIITLKDETVVEYYCPRYNDQGECIGWSKNYKVPPGTYRCRINWAFPPGPGSNKRIKNALPGFGTTYSDLRSLMPIDSPFRGDWDDCWEALPEALAPVIETQENFKLPKEYRSVPTNLYYGRGTMCVISFGADGKPGGVDYDRDISMTIYPFEYTGEVAGMVGNAEQDFADYVSICYPKYKQGSTLLEWRHRINIGSLPAAGSEDKCRNFRYGTAPLVGSTSTPDNEWNVDIPVGIRSIRAETAGSSTNDRIYVFTVESTGNFIGTIKANKSGTQGDVPGDINGDGVVDQDDYDVFMDALGSSEGDPNYNPAADLDGDGDVDLYDYYLFKKNYGQGTPGVPGDMNGDGQVDQSDYVSFQDALGSHPGDSNWNPAADLDKDGDVDLQDYYLFKKEF
ncbi:MAG: dockerin type I domain-containing protein [Desulfobacteraceae bacterium]|jgi:prepilin-type N-terminal cleavage/methylation domain-containing protein